MTYTLLFLGIILGILVERYVFAILDALLQVLSHKLSEIATKYQLNAQEQVALFNRKYPEMSEDKIQELTPAIGFTYQPSDDDEYYEEGRR